MTSTAYLGFTTCVGKSERTPPPVGRKYAFAPDRLPKFVTRALRTTAAKHTRKNFGENTDRNGDKQY